MATININNTTYSGDSISIINGKVYIDGADVTPDMKNITIEVTGNIDSVKIGACKSFIVNGNVGSIDSTSADVSCENVTKNVTTISGDVESDNIHGSVETVSGDVACETIGGSVNTLSGDIKYRK